MNKCLIVVDFYESIVNSLRKTFPHYVDERIENLLGVLNEYKDNGSVDLFYSGNQRFWFDIKKYNMRMFNGDEKYDEYYICGISLAQCVHSLYEQIDSYNKYIVLNCCLQEIFDEEDGGNFDHPQVESVDELLKFENDFLNGNIRFKFYDNSPNNDGRGEFENGTFDKMEYVREII